MAGLSPAAAAVLGQEQCKASHSLPAHHCAAPRLGVVPSVFPPHFLLAGGQVRICSGVILLSTAGHLHQLKAPLP